MLVTILYIIFPGYGAGDRILILNFYVRSSQLVTLKLCANVIDSATILETFFF